MPFIVIEGPDATGKTEQTDRLVTRVMHKGLTAAKISFPRYHTPTGYKVKEYLDGLLGPLESVSAERASKLFADDRKAAAEEIRSWIGSNQVVIANRYVASNMAHQGAKILEADKRREFFAWNDKLEYETNRIPAPDLNIILSLPFEVAAKRLEGRGNVKDIHESDEEYLRRAHQVYDEIAELFPERFLVASCMDGDRGLSRAEVHEVIWNIVSKRLQ